MRLLIVFVICYCMAITVKAGSIYSSEPDSVVCVDQSCCCSDYPTPAGVMISHVHKKNEWMFAYKYMSMKMHGIQSGGNSSSDADVFAKYLMSSESMRMDMHMMMLMYGITNRLTVMGMFNYLNNNMDMTMFSAASHHHSGQTASNNLHNMKSSGLGDTKLHLLYGVILKSNQQLLLSSGISIPTGSINLTGSSNDMMYPNTRFPYSMQLGSGSYEFLPSVNYLFQKSDFTYCLQASSIIRTNENANAYRLGNEVSANAWFAWQWHSFFSSSLRVEGSVSEKIDGQDPVLYHFNDLSSNPFNYGGRRLNVYAGSVFQIKKSFLKDFKFSLEYGIPVYQYVNGMQMKPVHNLFAGCSWSFI